MILAKETATVFHGVTFICIDKNSLLNVYLTLAEIVMPDV